MAFVGFSLPLVAGELPSNDLFASPAIVPIRVEGSESSSITKVDSNSAGSGSLPPISLSSFGRGFRGFLEGDSLAGRLEVEDVEADL